MNRIINIRIPTPDREEANPSYWWLALDDEKKVLDLQPMESASTITGENWNGDWISPMGMDLQINGGLGLSFTDLNANNTALLLKLLDYLWADGVEAICPTFISSETQKLRQALSTLRNIRNYTSAKRCRLLGAHLEGPFISKLKRGAHSSQQISQPTPSALNELINGFEEEINLVTLAPEFTESSKIIQALSNLGVVVCLGHSEANAEISKQSFQLGIKMLTHTFNGMEGLSHKDPGPIGEALVNGQIHLGLIADGVHVHPHMAVLLQKLAAKNLVLVSDALAPYGKPDGKYTWDNRTLISKAGSCRLEDGTLAGTTLPLLEGCKKLALWTGEPSQAIWAATVSPRKVLNKNINTQNCLIGKSLTDLLRWKLNGQEKAITWEHAI